MTTPPGNAGRSRRLSALSLDDEAGATTTNAVQRTDRTVPLAVYGGGGPGTTGAKAGTTTAPLAAQSPPPPVSAVGTPSVPTSSLPTPSVATPTSTAERASLASGAGMDKVDDDIEGPPMSKTPWGIIAGVGVVLVILGVVAAVVIGSAGTKSDGGGGAAPARSQ